MNDTATNSSREMGPEMQRGELPFLVTFTILMTYVTTCQLVDFIHKLKEKKISFHHQQLLIKNLPFILNFTTVLAGFFGVIYFLYKILTSYVWVRYSAVLFGFRVFLSANAINTQYIVLWLRQSSFHLDKGMEHLITKPMRYICYAEGIFVGVFASAYNVFLPCYFIATDCKGDYCFPMWGAITGMFLQFQSQTAMLILFAWPLIKHKLKKQVKSSKDDTIIPLVKRSAITCAVSILIDVFSTIAFIATFVGTINSGNLLVNYICLLFIYKDWMSRLFPWLPAQKPATVVPVDSSKKTKETST